MTPKTLIGLAVALVVLALLAVYGHRSESPDVPEDGLLLPQLAELLEDVDRVAVVGPGGEPVATLVRGESRWTVAEKDDYPADVAKIRETMVALAEARIVERKTSNPEYYDRLGVQAVEDDGATGIAITASVAGETVGSVVVGDAAGTGYRYVRLADRPESYMVDGELNVPRTTAEWVDPTIVDIRGARVERVTIEHPDGETVEISKTDPEQTNFAVQGVPEGRELLYPGVANVIGNSLRELRLEDVEAAATPLAAQSDEGPVEITFQTFDGLAVSVAGVERDDDGGWIELEATVAETPPASAATAAAAPAAGSDPAAAAPPAGDAASEGAADSGADAASSEAGAESTEPDPEQEATAINARVAGWRYRIPSYQFDQMTRRMADLLKAPADGANEPAE